MNSLGIFGFLAAVLQLSIPSYAFRMVRRFGVPQVGWFLALAFASLGLLHLLEPFHLTVFGYRSVSGLDAIYVIGSVLLLIGMAHVETVILERIRATKDAEKLKSECAVHARQTTDDLAQANKDMAERIARLELNEKQLTESEAHYRFLFTENPQPMWILDLRTLRFLAVNKAALAWHDYTLEEFMELGARGIVSAEAGDAFVQNIAKPCAGVDFRGAWPLRKKDGSVLTGELTAVDLRYYTYPARLVVANDVSARKRKEQESAEAVRIATIAKVAGGVAHHFNNLLTVVTGHTSLLLDKPLEADLRAQLVEIAAASQRGANLSRQLLAAGARQLITLEPTNVNDLLQVMNRVF